MGACGCIGSNFGVRIAGPEGSWYTIELYPGCEYCTELPGIHLGQYKPDHPMWDVVLEFPEVKPGELYGIPIADLSDAKYYVNETYGKDSKEAEFVEESLITLLRHSAHLMSEKWRQVLAKE